jgi:tetratricopeptide (TPR) repeat protein
MAKLKLYIILIIFGLSSSTYGQSLKSFLTAAEQAFEKRDFGAALNYYLTANEFDENRTDLLYKSAESARLYNALNVAEEKYQNVYDKESQSEFPLASFWLADIKQRLGKYDDAKRLYEVYLSEPYSQGHKRNSCM